MKIRAEPQGSYFNANLRRRNHQKGRKMETIISACFG